MRYHSPKRRQSTRDLRELRPILVERADGSCEKCGEPFNVDDRGEPIASLHHRKARTQGGLDTADNALLVHMHCHTIYPNSIHMTPAWSVENGWIVPRGQDPARTPVMIAGRMCWLRPDGTVEPVDGCMTCGSGDCSPERCQNYAYQED